jgi:Flp pilus assembly protein TadG
MLSRLNPLRMLKRLGRSRRGAVLIEMGFFIPAFALISIGGYDGATYLQHGVKASRISTSFSDMIGEGGQFLTVAQVTDMVRNFQALADPNAFSPNVANDARVIITAFRGTGSANEVMWKYCTGGLTQASAYPAVNGTVANLDGNLLLDLGQTAVVTEVFIRYRPISGLFLDAPVTVRDRATFVSRMSNLNSPLANPGNINPASFGVNQNAGC